MASLNKVILLGNLGSDPEIRYISDGNSICNLSLATSSQWKDKNSGETKKNTEWHRIVLYNRLSEIANEYLKKGRLIYIEGRLKTRKWKDKENGIYRYTTEIIAEQMLMINQQNENKNEYKNLDIEDYNKSFYKKELSCEKNLYEKEKKIHKKNIEIDDLEDIPF